jgi:hypothetical protein
MLLLAQVAIAAAKSPADIHCFSDLKDVRGPMDPPERNHVFHLSAACGHPRYGKQ